MSTISPSESQYFKELVTPFQPIGRLLVGTDLRGTQCDRFGKGDLRLVGYGDSSGGYAFTPANQDAAIASSLNSSVLLNIANSLPRITEVQDYAGKWIDTITLHALDEFIEQIEPASFIGNTLRIFCAGQKGFRGDGTGNRNVRNTYTLVAEIPIPALSRADIPRSFNVKVAAYIPPAQNIYLGLALPQPYTCSFEIWDLQANTQIGSGFSSSIGGSSSVGEGNDLSKELANTPADTRFVLPIQFASATWVKGVASEGVKPPPPSTSPTSIAAPPPSIAPPPSAGAGAGANVSVTPSEDKDNSKPSPESPSKPTPPPSQANPPPSAGCIPPQNCNWYKVTSAQSAKVDMNLNGGTSLCPKDTVARGIVDFSTAGSFVLCCSAATYPPDNLGCSSLTKWSCVSGGTCVQDPLGIYNSQAECEAALVPPPFLGGQSAGVLYRYEFAGTRYNGSGWYNIGTANSFSGQDTPHTDIAILTQGAQIPIAGPLNGWTLNDFGTNGTLFINGIYTGLGVKLDAGVSGEGVVKGSIRLNKVLRADGLPDTGGNLPPVCP